jgi:uncharacterized protein (TIGR02246 family)
MKADAKTEAAVKAVMDRLAMAYAKRDLAMLQSTFAQEPDVVMIGTGADEKRMGPEEIRIQAERDWAQTDDAALTYDWTSISSAGPVAWAATDVTMKVKAGGQEMKFPLRASLVLEKRGDEWLIVHVHMSSPAAGQAEGESWPTQ